METRYYEKTLVSAKMLTGAVVVDPLGLMVAALTLRVLLANRSNSYQKGMRALPR